MMARELVTHPDFAKYDTSSLLAVGGGGAQLQPDLVAKIDAAVATARPNTGYGMTETCGIITSVSGDFFVDKPSSCGRAMPTFETRIVGDDGQELPPGEPGELWVRGAPVIKGYINRLDATAESITDGWLHTGDVARIDEDGFIFLVDRKKDMVLRGGENIYCAEVEAAMLRLRRAGRAAGRGGGRRPGGASGRDPDGAGAARSSRSPDRPAQGAALRVVPRYAHPAQRQRKVPEARAARKPEGRRRGLADRGLVLAVTRPI